MGATMSNTIPTAKQLQPLYDAALAYGKASAHTSKLYRQAKHKRTAAVSEASQAEGKLYRAMNAAREALDVQFPGLYLSCPAPWVGWTANLDSYRRYVAGRLTDYVLELWAKRHRTQIARVRELARDIPLTDTCGVGDVVSNGADLYRVERVTPKRRNIMAVSLSTGERRQLSGAHKRFDQPLVDELLAMRKSRLRALKAAGLSEGTAV
jgi:hypothetical protein